MRPLLILLVHLTSSFAIAQQPTLFFEKIDVQNGLSNNKVNCILQDKRGFTWLGTDDGLNRYDGKNFLIFRHRQNDSTSLSGNIITDILEDSKERIWIATADGGLTRYDYRLPPSKQFRQYRHLPGDRHSIPVNIINTLTEDRFGFLWLGTSGKAILRFDKNTEAFTEVTPKGTRTIVDFSIDKKGIIWAGRQGGSIVRIDPIDLSYEEDKRYYDLYAKLPHAAITSLYNDQFNNTWFGSWDKVLYRFVAGSGKEEAFMPGSEYAFHGDEILCFTEDKQGRLWMGGKQGLQVFNKNNGRFYHYQFDPSKEGSIADNQVNCMFRDAAGRIWLGTNKGLSINNPGKQQFVQNFLIQRDKPAQNNIYDFHEDDNGKLWIGTSEGIFSMNDDGSFINRKLFYKNIPLQVTCFYEDEEGRIYIGTDYSLFVYNASNNSISLLPNTEKDGVMNRIIDSRIVSITNFNINGEKVLLTSPYGHYLSWYNLDQKKWVSRLDTSLRIIDKMNLKDNLIRKFYKTKDGELWMSTVKEGLGNWNREPFPTTMYFSSNPYDGSSISNNNVYDIKEAQDKSLWISTYGGGLNHFDRSTKKFTQIPASSNLGEGLALDDKGNVWMISNGNLHKYDPGKQLYTSFSLPDREKTGGVKGNIFKDDSGKLYVAGNNYYISFHPDSLTETYSSPKVQLTNFSIFNNSFSHLLYADEIKLKHRDNYFSIEFAAPDYASPVFYSYMLEGFDRDWIDAGNRTYASYPNLEGGNYVFKVRASNSPGTWDKDFVSLNIEIIPPFWKRWWFYALCAVAIASLIYAIYRYRINELLKRQAIRNKIAQDLHDNVGSTLSSISVYSQVAKIYHQQQKQDDLKDALEKISSTSGEMISELNDTVWAINPRNDNMEVIMQRMESLARPLMASQGINFHFDQDHHLYGLNLDMEKRKNFYLIFKEAVNNVLKYADCKNLFVTINAEGKNIIMSILDDGKGFDMAKTSEGFKSSDVYGGGNGLKNMQLRAKEMNGRLKLESSPGKGCIVEIVFPIT